MSKYAIVEGGVVVNIVKASEAFAASQGWVAATAGVSAGWAWDGEAFSPPTVDPAVELAAERAAMICTPAQMRLALNAAGLLATVQTIADSNPEASILWEYGTQFIRTSPLIDALGGPNGFTPEQIDDLFRAAMAVQT